MADLLTNMIPFFFVLAIVYGALDYSNVLKKNSVKAIISLVIAFFAITYQPLVDFIYLVLPYAVILFIVVFFLAFISKLFKGKGGEGGKGGERDWTLIAIIVILILIATAAYGQDILNNFLPAMPAENFLYAVGLVLVLLIFYAAYKNWGKEE